MKLRERERNGARLKIAKKSSALGQCDFFAWKSAILMTSVWISNIIESLLVD